MKEVYIYDISTKTWFTQSTTAVAGRYPDAQGSLCSVGASAADNSSHNIYIYGGFHGAFHEWMKSSNDVFILTLPAFHWVLVYTDEDGADPRRTYGHRCQKVHEKHMVAYRGQGSSCENDSQYGEFQGISIYDMSSLTWTTNVELENQTYLVPQELYERIGGK